MVVLTVSKSNIVQVRTDVTSIARSLLTRKALGEGVIHGKAHPELLFHLGWPRIKGQLRHSLEMFNKAVNLPVQSEGADVRV